MSKKKIGVSFVSMFIVLLSIGFISAGFFNDLFGFGSGDEDLKGELRESFNVGVTVGNNAPIIDSWTKPESSIGSGGYSPTLCRTDVVVEDMSPKIGVVVTVSDLDGCQDLADDGTVDVYFRDGAVNRPTGGAIACGESEDPSTCVGNTVDFTCPAITMKYYDADSNWIIDIVANDGKDSYVKVSDGTVDYPFLVYGQSTYLEFADTDDSSVDVGDDTVEFLNIRLDSVDDDASVNLEVYNCGNVNYDGSVNTMQITGSDLVGQTPGNTDKIEETSFSVDDVLVPPGACDTGLVLSESAQSIPGASLAPDADGQARSKKQISFCLEQVDIPGPQVGLQPDSYAPGTNWDITACTSGC